MCGITGALWFDPALAVDRATLARMTDILAHRGPDDRGEFTSELRFDEPYGTRPGVALGHRRLSILDLEASRQPMANEDESLWLVFNGEIYNYADLRGRLEGAGHRFRTRGDTETILHLYEDEGLEAFSRLNGMFALALWDSKRRRLVLARDRLGKKPLYYRAEANRILFASELKSLLQIPGLPREIDPAAIDHYLAYQYVPHPRCALKGFHKLPPGHYAVFSERGLEARAYWNPDFTEELPRTPAARQEASEQLKHTLEDSIRLRMQSDVPLGAFLSGGIDSSLVVALMQQASERPVRTFAIGFPESQFDETQYARRVAEHLKTEHHEFRVTPAALDILPQLAWHYDEPFGDSSIIPTWYVSREARRFVTVVLTGDGGDELFAGYDRYRGAYWAAKCDRLPVPLRALATAKFWTMFPAGESRSLLRRARRFSEALRKSPPARYLNWVGVFPELMRADLYNDDFVARLGDADPLQFLVDAWRRAGNRDDATAASVADLFTYLPCDILHKVDIASMAHALECRQPLLDYRAVELAMRMPTSWKTNGRRGKLILQQMYGNLLPREVWTRRKMGFGVPLERWFRHELRAPVRDWLLASDARCHAMFRVESLARLIEEHERAAADHSHRLWALAMLEMWLREWT